MSAHFWRQGSPTAWARTVYTAGDCWLLAAALYRLGSFPIYLVEDGEHYVVKVGPNRYLDIDGVQSRSTVLRRWDASSLIKAQAPFVTTILQTARFTNVETWEGGQRRAPDMARRLIEKYHLEAS